MIQANIPLQVKQPDFESPLEAQAKVMSIQDMIQRRDLQRQEGQLRSQSIQQNDLALKQQQRAQQGTQLWADTLRNNTKLEDGHVVFDEPAIETAFTQNGFADLVPKFREQQDALRKQARDAFKDELQTTHEKAMEVDRMAADVVDEPTYQQFRTNALRMNPAMKLPGAYDDSAKDTIKKIQEETKKLRVSLMTPLEQLEYADRVASLPENQSKEIARRLQLYSENNKDQAGNPVPAPQWFKDAVMADVMKIPQMSRPSTPQKRGQLTGDQLPPDATTISGQPITKRDKGTTYSKYYIGDQLAGYEAEVTKPLAADRKRDMAIEAAQAANPSLTPEEARTLVLKQEYQKARLDVLNAQELSEGRELDNKTKRDILDGKLSPVSARMLITNIASRAAKLATPEVQATLEEGSPYSGKSLPQLENLLLGELGFTRKELTDAIAAKPGNAPSKPADSGTIRVRNKKTGQTGTMPAKNFDPAKYERIQ